MHSHLGLLVAATITLVTIILVGLMVMIFCFRYYPTQKDFFDGSPFPQRGAPISPFRSAPISSTSSAPDDPCTLLGPICSQYERGVPTILNHLFWGLCPPGQKGETGYDIEVKSLDGTLRYLWTPIYCQGGKALFDIPVNVNLYEGDQVKWRINASGNTTQRLCGTTTAVSLTSKACAT